MNEVHGQSARKCTDALQGHRVCLLLVLLLLMRHHVAHHVAAVLSAATALSGVECAEAHLECEVDQGEALCNALTDNRTRACTQAALAVCRPADISATQGCIECTDALVACQDEAVRDHTCAAVAVCIEALGDEPESCEEAADASCVFGLAASNFTERFCESEAEEAKTWHKELLCACGLCPLAASMRSHFLGAPCRAVPTHSALLLRCWLSHPSQHVRARFSRIALRSRTRRERCAAHRGTFTCRPFVHALQACLPSRVS
jgi:hypothetical protein